MTIRKHEHRENRTQSCCVNGSLSFQLLHIVLFFNLYAVLALLGFPGRLCYDPIQLDE